MLGSLRAKARHKVRKHVSATSELRLLQQRAFLRSIDSLVKNKGPSRFLKIYLLTVLFIIPLFLYIIVQSLGLKQSDFPNVTDPAYLSDEIPRILLNVQVTLTGIILPLVIALVALLPQPRSRARTEVYLHTSRAYEIAASSIMLIIVLSVEQMFTISNLIETSFSTLGSEIYSYTVFIVTPGIWLVLNSLAIWNLLVISFSFITPDGQSKIIRQFLARESVPRDIEDELTRLYLSAPELFCLLPRNDGTSNLSDDRPRVVFGSTASSLSEIEVKGDNNSNYILNDVRFRLLKCVISRWKSRAAKNISLSPRLGLSPLESDAEVLGFPCEIGVQTIGANILCNRAGKTGLNWLERLLVRLSFVFLRDSPQGLKRLAPTEPLSILEQFSSEVCSPMDKRALENFADALESMTTFHAFLLRSYSISEGGSYTDSFALIPKSLFWGITIHESWNRQYHHIFDRATDLLEHHLAYYQKSVGVTYRLVQQTSSYVPPQILNSLLDLTTYLFFRTKNWWLRRVIAETGNRSSISEPVSLSGYEAMIYKSVVSDFVGVWEQFWCFPDVRWRQDLASLDNDEKWYRLGVSISFIRHHLYCTARMLAAAVYSGDKVSASIMSDSLIIEHTSPWKQDSFDMSFSTSLIDSSIFCRNTWEDALLDPRLDDLASRREIVPETVFHAAFENLMVDVILTVSAILVSWCGDWSDRHSLPLKIAQKLLFGGPSDGAKRRNPASEVSSVVALMTIVRQCTSGAEHEKSDYREWLDGVVRDCDSFREGDFVPGRFYDILTKLDTTELRSAQLAIIVSLANSGLSGNIPTALRDTIITINKLPYTDDLARCLESQLVFFNSGFQEASVPQWSKSLDLLERSDSAKASFDGRKDAISKIFLESLDLVKQERAARIKELPVLRGRLDNWASVVQSRVFGQGCGGFPLDRIPVVSIDRGLERRDIFRGCDVPKGAFTSPEMDVLASRDRQINLARYVGQVIINCLLLEVFSSGRVDDIVVENASAYWHAVKTKSIELVERGLEPILLVGGSARPRWIWQWIQIPLSSSASTRPEDMLVTCEKVDVTEDYLATFNGTNVYRNPIAKNASFLLARESFRKLELRKFANDCHLDVRFEESDDPWRGDLVFAWAHRLEVALCPVWKLIWKDEN